MTDHEHVEMLIDRVDCEGSRRIGGGGKYVCFPADFDDVRRVSTARTFRVVGVNGAPFERSDCVLHEAAFIQSVRMDRDLDVEFIRHSKTTIDGGGRRSPIFMKLQTNGACQYLLAQRLWSGAIAFPE